MNIAVAPANDGSHIKEGFTLYHSPKLGFDIAYPSDWVVEESGMEDGIYIDAPVSTQSENDNGTKSIDAKSIEEALNEAQKKIEDINLGESESISMGMFVRNQTAQDPDNIKTLGVQSLQSKRERISNVNIIEASETTFAGLPAFKTVYTYGLSSGIKEMSIQALSNNKTYTLSYSAPSYLYDIYLPEVEYAINSTKIK
jgi:hypothetical protein